MGIRVVQWTTGSVGQNAVRAVLAHPALELVGAYAWSADKAGRDVGELCGLDPLGITAVADIDEVVAVKPDVVLYMPMLWDVDDMVGLLEAGINVISTANFITGHSYGEKSRQRLRDAAEQGGASLYGTGINPGLASAIALTVAGGVRDLERISIFEAADCSGYESKETWEALGFSKPPDTPGLADGARMRQLVFMDAVEMTAAALGVELDDVIHRLDLGIATRDIDLGFMQIPAGTVCGQKGVWTGVYHGRALIEIGLAWWLSSSMEPDFTADGHGHLIEVLGTPSFRVQSEIVRPATPDPLAFTSETAHAAVNAVPAVVAARPGLITIPDLPLVTAGSVLP
jgi:hypothetical protein